MKINYKKVSFLALIGIAIILLGGLVAANIFHSKYLSSFLTASLLVQPQQIKDQDITNFAVLAGSTITNIGNTIVNGDLGLYPGTSVTGFGPGIVNGTQYISDAGGVVTRAQADLTTDYNTIRDKTPYTVISADLGTLGTLLPGIYHSGSSLGLTGTVTLDGGSNPNAVFIFQAPDSTLTTASNSHVNLTNGAQACNVFWQVGSSATLGTSSDFKGNILALESITDDGNSTVLGRLLANTGAVTLSNTQLTKASCVPSLLLQKTVSAGGPDDPSAWTLTATGTATGLSGHTPVNSDVAFSNATFQAGTYTLGETGPTTNYAATYSCVKNGGMAVAGNSITLVAGDKAICTITNTYTAPTTPINGTCGTAAKSYLYTDTVFSGTMCANGNGITDPVSPAFPTVGNYITWTCGGSNGGISSSTCTATRASAPITTATLTLVKIIVGGTRTFTDFPLTATGPTSITGVYPASTITNATVDAGIYTLSETTQSDYTAEAWSCLKNATLPAVTGNSITLVPGDSAICTIQNTYITPSSSVGGNSYVISTPVAPLIDVVKVPSPLALPNGSGLVTYTYTLRNIGIVSANNITMVDDSCSPVKYISGDINGDSKLDTTERWTYTCSTTLTSTHTNTVVATGWANGVSSTDIATATVVVGTSTVPPLIHITKVPNPLVLPAGGGMVIYTKKVTNPGTVPLNNIQLIDDKCGPVKYISGDINGDSKLDPSETWVYTCSTNLTKTTTNTVVVTGQANGLTAKDFAIATVVVASPKLPMTGLDPIF